MSTPSPDPLLPPPRLSLPPSVSQLGIGVGRRRTKEELENILRLDAQQRFLKKRGNSFSDIFGSSEKVKLKNFFFQSLDVDRHGFVSTASVESALTGLGLVCGHAHLRTYFQDMELMEFSEFCVVIEKILSDKKIHSAQLRNRLKSLFTGGGGLKFPTVVASERRRLLLNGVLGSSHSRGTRMLKAFENELLRGEISSEERENMIQRKIEKQIKNIA